MYEERFTEQHKLGLERFDGSNAGRFFTNERTEQVEEQGADGTAVVKTYYVYDVYEVADCRDPHKVKDSVITEEHPFGDETKILRKTIRKMLSEAKYNSADFAEFRTYNEFCESV